MTMSSLIIIIFCQFAMPRRKNLSYFTEVKLNTVMMMLVTLNGKMQRVKLQKILISCHLRKFFHAKMNFFPLAKVFFANFAQKTVIGVCFCQEFLVFYVTHKFLLSKVSAFKIVLLLLTLSW